MIQIKEDVLWIEMVTSEYIEGITGIRCYPVFKIKIHLLQAVSQGSFILSLHCMNFECRLFN
jgi:hypothetical protein